MAKFMVFTLTEKKITARARLFEDLAPETCGTLWERAPYEGDCVHAIHSGNLAALLIDPAIVIRKENASVHVETGDIMFLHYGAREAAAYPNALSEILWAYDRSTNLVRPGELVPVSANIFGKFLPGAEPFFEANRRIPFEGVTPMTIACEEGD